MSSIYLNKVGGQGVRAAHEAQHCSLVAYYVPQFPQSLSDKGASLFWLNGMHPLYLLAKHNRR